jgi:hypothetical protein
MHGVIKILSSFALMIAALACGGGGSGTSSASVGDTISSTASTTVASTVATSVQQASKFDYAMVQQKNLTITVTGLNPTGPACLVQVRVCGDDQGQEYGQWKGYMVKDGKLDIPLNLSSEDLSLKLIVHQVGKTSDEMLSTIEPAELFMHPSYVKEFRKDTMQSLDIILKELPEINLSKNREKVPTEKEFVDRNIKVPQSVLNIVNTLLPEGVMPGASYLNTKYNPNLPIVANATIDVTFIHEGAGYRNSFGYFTYTRNANGP